MPRRRVGQGGQQGARNSVRGPQSALTEFLRAQGISASEIRASHALRQRQAEGLQQQGQGQRQELEQEVNDQAIEEVDELQQVPNGAVASSSTRPADASGYLSLEEEDEEDEEEVDFKGKQKQTVKARAKKKRKTVDSDDDLDFFVPSRAPNPGQVEFCDECLCRFTVTPYSKSSAKGGLLCHPCGRKLMNSEVDTNARAKKVPAKRRQGKDAAKALLDGKKFKVPKLQDLCIKLIAKHIDDVEAFGDIGRINMDKICQIISKNRSLTNATLALFLDSSAKELALYDCSKISDQVLQSIAALCPSLQTLMMNFCGHLTDAILRYFIVRLEHLMCIDLSGPFLVTTNVWKELFEKTGHRLRKFLLRDTPRFDDGVINSLVQNCPHLSELRLSRIYNMRDEGVVALSSLKNLTSLNISYPQEKISEESLVDLLNGVGTGLLELDLSGIEGVTDAVLDAIRLSCGHLRKLRLEHCNMISTEGVVNMFENWPTNRGLEAINLARCTEVGDDGLRAILCHSGHTLKALSLNSLDTITADGLKTLADAGCPVLAQLDLGFIRPLDDTLVEQIANQTPSLSSLRVWGNPHVTNLSSVLRAELTVIGIETFA